MDGRKGGPAQIVKVPAVVRTLTTLDALDAKIQECNDALNTQDDDAMRQLFSTFRLNLSAQLPPDLFNAEYCAFKLALHQRITGKPYSVANERTLFDLDQYRYRPFPYYLGSTTMAGRHLKSIGFMLDLDTEAARQTS